MRRHKSVRMVLALGFALLAMIGGTRGAAAAFTPLVNQPPAFLNSCLLLTDGSVMCQGFFSNTWHRLTPDAFGSYLNGTWDAPPIAPMPDANDARIGCTNLRVLAALLRVPGSGRRQGRRHRRRGSGLGPRPGRNQYRVPVRPGEQHLVVAAGLRVRQRNGRRHDVDVLQDGTMIVSQITSGNIDGLQRSGAVIHGVEPARARPTRTTKRAGTSFLTGRF